MPNKKNTVTDLQGLTHLLKDAVVGITDLVEAMQKQIVHPPFLPSTPIQHLISDVSQFAYKNIRWSASFVGSAVDKALEQLTFILGEIKTTEDREALRAVLNGVIGDYLEKHENPLKIAMQFRHEAQALSLNSKSLKKAYPTLHGKILVMVHGSSMNDLQWTRKAHNHGAALAKELQKTPVYLYYNSGLHVSTNGQNFSNLLEALLQNYPVPVEEICILAHSMGGLVSRSAMHYAQKQQKSWIKHLKKIVFLGTPHHGASLEQAGNYVDVILEATAYTKPFARLGKIRSAGVTDLRYGNLVDEDWQDADRFEMKHDQRQHIPLPEGVECHSIAGVSGKGSTKPLSSQWLGDNLVSVKSAFGQHKNPSKNLHFKKENTWIAYECNHFDLLSNPEVYHRIRQWIKK